MKSNGHERWGVCRTIRGPEELKEGSEGVRSDGGLGQGNWGIVLIAEVQPDPRSRLRYLILCNDESLSSKSV